MQAGCPDGETPYAGLMQATDGNLYGATQFRGANYGNGTIFRCTLDGTLTTLHIFEETDGSEPLAPLMQATDGNFYGTTHNGGIDRCEGGCGTIFTLSVGLGAFVETQPTSGKAGAAVKILGANLTGAVSVGFNGAAAAFEVVSSSEITTTVPAGASSGTVQVGTPGGMPSSNVPFTVP